MALTVGTNSYISLADAELYCADRNNTATWDAMTDTVKSNALIQATQSIDFKNFVGNKTSSAQKLKFPRTDLYDDGISVSSATVPQRVLDATCEAALSMSETDYAASDDLSQFDSVKIGPISVVTRQGATDSTGAKQLPPYVLKLLSPFVESSSKMYLG